MPAHEYSEYQDQSPKREGDKPLCRILRASCPHYRYHNNLHINRIGSANRFSQSHMELLGTTMR